MASAPPTTSSAPAEPRYVVSSGSSLADALADHFSRAAISTPPPPTQQQQEEIERAAYEQWKVQQKLRRALETRQQFTWEVKEELAAWEAANL